MGDQEELAGYVGVWWQAVNDFAAVLEEVPADQWSAPTDLPGWDVHAVAAHTAHLEALLDGARHVDVEIGDASHARGTMGQFTEQGVVARRGASPDELINEIHESATARHTTLLAEPPTDADAPAQGLFGAIGWSTRTLLRNRPLDVWMHEQDIRRAIGMPGGLDTEAAVHSAAYLIESFPFVVAKRAKAPAGTTVRLDVAGHEPVVVSVDDNGRGHVVDADDNPPTVTLRTDRESFVLLAGGRRGPDRVRVEVDGDLELGARILEAMGVTP